MFRQNFRRVQAIILAGGFGTRINHLLGDKPKPLAEVNGHPFLYWLICYLTQQGIFDIAFSTHHKSEQIESYVEKFKGQLMSCRCIYEESPLGTAGGALNVVRKLNEKKDIYLVLNGDSLFPINLDEAFNTIVSGAKGVIIGLMTPETSRYGQLLVGKHGKLIGFKEKNENSDSGLINAGIYLFKDDVLKPYLNSHSTLSFEYDLFPRLLEKGVDIRVVKGRAPFLDIGTQDSFAYATKFIRKLLDEKLLSEIKI